MTARFAAQGFSGPLPPPQMLVQYNQAFPGCAERIVAMAERQATHRQDLEKTAITSNRKRELTGLGLLIALSAIACGTYLAIYDKSVAGLGTIIGTVASLVAVFIYGKYTQKKELDQKKL
jgi:uncharacterized membrane protein